MIIKDKAQNNELKGSAPIGMLEYWNDGKMGLKAFLIIRLFFIFYPQYSTIPSFHYSIWMAFLKRY